jgi:nucleoside-diphosphate-sugar epimerase
VNKTLVIGGTGFISGRIVHYLLARGDRVTLINRGRSKSEMAPPVELIVADRTMPDELERGLGGRTFDIVYDMVAYRPEESATIARLLRGKVGRFVHCSTVSVYMISEKVKCPITEDQDHAPPMEFWPRNPFGMEYGILKRECEDVLWKAHNEKDFPVTMLRPTFVSGENDPAGRDFFWIERILDGGPLLVPGSGNFVFQQVYLDDVARMFALLPELPVTAGEAYNIAGEETLTLNEYLQALGDLLGRRPGLVHVDQETFDTLPFSSSPDGDVFPFNTRRDTLFSLEKIKAHAAFRSTSFTTWMIKTIAWWKTGARGHSHGYEHRSDELAFARSFEQAGTG